MIRSQRSADGTFDRLQRKDRLSQRNPKHHGCIDCKLFCYITLLLNNTFKTEIVSCVLFKSYQNEAALFISRMQKRNLRHDLFMCVVR